jgi:hypothetical protein
MGKIKNAFKKAGCSIGNHDLYSYDLAYNSGFDVTKNQSWTQIERVTKCQVCDYKGPSTYRKEWK